MRKGAAPPPLAVLVGPEGGFADHERAALNALPDVVRLSGLYHNLIRRWADT